MITEIGKSFQGGCMLGLSAMLNNSVARRQSVGSCITLSAQPGICTGGVSLFVRSRHRGRAVSMRPHVVLRIVRAYSLGHRRGVLEYISTGTRDAGAPTVKAQAALDLIVDSAVADLVFNARDGVQLRGTRAKSFLSCWAKKGIAPRNKVLAQAS
jgi:hypothetical protein